MSKPPNQYIPPPPPFCVDVERGDRVTRVAISGEIDIKTVAPIEERIEAATSASTGRHLIVDLRGLTFMDSTGLRLLMGLLRDSEANAYRLTFVRPVPDVFRPIELTGLDRILTFVEDPTEAALD